MSAAEIIEQIKQLSEDDRHKVREFLLNGHFEHATEKIAEEPVKYATDAEFEKASTEVFKKYDNLFRKLAE